MRNDGQRIGGDGGAMVPRTGRGNSSVIPNSFRVLSRIVSSGASTVASGMRSAAFAASSIKERDNETNRDPVSWAGFDKLELEKGVTRQVLLLAYSYGFQVWDVEVADNVHNLVTRQDGPVSFMQMLPKPVSSNQPGNKFAESHPMLVICADESFSGDNNVRDGRVTNGSTQHNHGSITDSYVPMVIWFYSLRSQSYVHILRFRSVVHLVRCSSRVLAVLQSTQIHCFNVATLEREYTILTNPVVPGLGNIGVGPLAVGPRWMAYSGSQVVSNYGRVSPQHLSPSTSFSGSGSNGSLVAHYAKESSKQIAAGIVTLGDMGYKKLTRYYSDLLPEANNCQSVKLPGVANGHLPDPDDVGMVIVRDIVSKTVIAQFRAHKSPISSLCFDPSGTLLVTASIQGHNINVFRIMPELSGSSSGQSHVHLYRLQRGLTNAVIQDISFSSDSQWIMVSSSRGTGHLFAVSPSGGPVNFQATHVSPNSRPQVLTQQNICVSGPPVTLSAVSRIRSGNSGWRNTVSGAVSAAATGRMNSPPGVIASVFHNCKGSNNNNETDRDITKKNYYLLVFSPGCAIQYALRISPAFNGMPGVSESIPDYDARLLVEPIQKWNICQKQNYKEDNIDVYGENGSSDSSSKVYPERMKRENNLFSDAFGNAATKEKITTEEKHHMYISEAELQMHQNRYPLWARSKIHFQPMVVDGFDIDEGGASRGETEIERVQIRTLEARAKNLVPVFDYLQTPKSQQGRTFVTNSDNNVQFQPRESDVSEDGNESDNGLIGNEGQDGLLLPGETSRGLINTNDNPITNETVNTRENSDDESQLSSVHNRDGLKIKNQVTEDEESG